jgi:hypothetical protein
MRHTIFTSGYLAAITLAQSCTYKETGRCFVHDYADEQDWINHIFGGDDNMDMSHCSELCPAVSNHAGDWQLDLTDTNAATWERQTLIENDHCRFTLSRSSGAAGDPLNIALANDDIVSMLYWATKTGDSLGPLFGGSLGMKVNVTCDGKNFTYWME